MTGQGQSRQAGGVSGCNCSPRMCLNRFMHAHENHPTFTLLWRATHVTSSPLEVAVTFLGSMLESGGTRKVPLEDNGTRRACTESDGRWPAHSFESHTSFPCHGQPRLTGTVEKQGGNFNMRSASVGMAGLTVYDIPSNDFFLGMEGSF